MQCVVVCMYVPIISQLWNTVDMHNFLFFTEYFLYSPIIPHVSMLVLYSK